MNKYRNKYNFKKFEREVAFQVDYQILSKDIKTKYGINSGVLSILDIISHNPKEVFITGISLLQNTNKLKFERINNSSDFYETVIGQRTISICNRALSNEMMSDFVKLMDKYKNIIELDTTLQKIVENYKNENDS